MKKIILFLILLLVPISFSNAWLRPAASQDFVRASGKKLVVGVSNTDIVLNGINISVPTDSDDGVADIQGVKAVSQKDFQNIADMGFNAIRLNMNYKIFEDDINPGVFKSEGWEWLDGAVSYAKSAGLYLMIDMHAPQGGYQSDKNQGFVEFWGANATDANTINQNRLIALWSAIANRYKNETTLIGYDLINEPRPYTDEEWFSFAEQLITAIRNEDANHMIIVEAPFISSYTMRTVADANVMYDAHMYTPWNYTTQYSVHYGNSGQEWGVYDTSNPIYLDYSYNIVNSTHPEATPFDRNFLVDALNEEIVNFTNTNNVPVNVGEYGIVHEAYEEQVGACEYIKDFNNIMDGNNTNSININRFYYAYQGTSFGLYTNWTGFDTNNTDVNTKLKNYFEKGTCQDEIVLPESETKPVYRFYSPRNKAHFFTVSESEKNNIIATYPTTEWRYEGISYSVPTSSAGNKPVYRFYSPNNKSHFFTTSKSEKDNIIATYPTTEWRYEGIAYYVPTTSSGNKPVYRFYSPNNKAHFFTTSKSEKDNIIATYPTTEWRYENIAYYVSK